MAYTKGETLKLTMFWCTVISIIFFVIEGILAAARADYNATVAMFAIAIVFAVVAFGIWLYVKVKKTNRKLTT